MFYIAILCFIQCKRWRSEAFLWEIRNNVHPNFHAELCCVVYTIVIIHVIICGYSVKSQHFIGTEISEFSICCWFLMIRYPTLLLMLKKKPVWFCSYKQIQTKVYIIVCLKIFMQHTWTIFNTNAHTYMY